MKRIGWLDNARADDPAAQARVATVRQDLENSGWIVGRNLQIDYRWGVINPEMAQRSGAELLSLVPDVILCAGSPGVKALQQATSSVPIVFVLVAEPVAQGFVHSLARPGANITGFTYLERTVGAKWLELITQIAPKVKRVAYIFSPKAAPYAHFYYESAESAAGKFGVQTEFNPVNEPADVEPIVARVGEDGGIIFNPDAFMLSNIQLVADVPARYRVPAIYGNTGPAKAGLDRLQPRSYGSLPGGRDVSRSHPQRREVGRSPGPAADEIRLCHQSEDRQGARHRRAADAASCRQRGD
jgi:putative ABC transport system substrate-binding protein